MKNTIFKGMATAIVTPMTAQNALQSPVVEETVRDTYTDPTVQQMAAEMETPSLEEAYGGQ